MTDVQQVREAATAFTEPELLGPFLGYVTSTSIKIWLYREGATAPVYVTIHPRPEPGKPVTLDSVVASGTLNFEKEKLFAACVAIDGLQPDTDYVYRLWTTPTYAQAV